MPAPTAAAIEGFIRAAIVLRQAEGKFLKRDNEGNVISGIPEGMEDLIAVIAEGIATQWNVWQVSAVVVGTAAGITPGPSAAVVAGVIQ